MAIMAAAPCGSQDLAQAPPELPLAAVDLLPRHRGLALINSDWSEASALTFRAGTFCQMSTAPFFPLHDFGVGDKLAKMECFTLWMGGGEGGIAVVSSVTGRCFLLLNFILQSAGTEQNDIVRH